MTGKPLPSIHARDVHGYCPACGNPTLRLGDDGRIVCTLMDCPRPDLVNELIGDIADARSHAGYTFCSQLVGHVTMTAFAKKITEKVTAVGQRKEAVEYANEQKRRAEKAEAVLAEVLACFTPCTDTTPDTPTGWRARRGIDTVTWNRWQTALRDPGIHVYLSTGCLHGRHDYCQGHTGLSGAKRPAECKHCGTRCICHCHKTSEKDSDD